MCLSTPARRIGGCDGEGCRPENGDVDRESGAWNRKRPGMTDLGETGWRHPQPKGRRHDNVVHEGLIIGQIPRHPSVSVGIHKALVLALRAAGLISALALLVWIDLA